MPELSTVLLRRLHTVYVDQAGPRPGDPSTTEGLTALEAELLDRGYALTGPLRSALAWLGPTGLAAAGGQLIADIDILLGADRTHMPLFRSFPASVPDDTHTLWIDRVLTLLLQWPDQPCVLCATVGGVHPVAPCAHLVCRTCWDGADYTGCPICHRRIDAADPFIRPSPHPGDVPSGGGPLRLLAFGTDRAVDSVTALGKLLARRTPLSPQDTEEARVLLAHVPAGLDWLPDDIPVRGTKALVLGTLLRERRTREAVRALLPERLTTATDVLRLLAVWSGGEADLLEPPRLRSLPRPLRRELLAVLDGLDPALLVEDVLRHEDLWKRAAEILHPFEQHARHPRTALAFAVLRGTDTTGTALGAALLTTAAAYPHAVRIDGSRVRAATWLGRAEEALRGGDPDRALAVLAERPGELVRRLDHLLRLYAADTLAPQVAEVLARRLPKVGPGPLLSALGRLRIRHLPGTRRVFFPRGQVAHSFTVDDARAPLAEAVTREVCELFEAEVLRRLASAGPCDMAVLDSRLAHLHVPSAERAAAKALVTVPKGSFQALPDGEVLRMFLHWMEPARTRVDLDLSVVLFDTDWNYVGLCDYTKLVHGERAVVHSGDLVSAPAPHGASEYVDIDLDALADTGVRFAMPVVFSFNNIPFELLPDAFAGFMALPTRSGRTAHYDPRTVRQRYDLVGNSRIHVPLLVDLERRGFLWTDVHLPDDEDYHSVWAHQEDLARIGRDLFQYFSTGRTTLWELAGWHAAARCREVTVLRRTPRPSDPDELWTYRRGSGEDTTAFAARLVGLRDPDAVLASAEVDVLAGTAASGRSVFLALVDGEVAPAGANGSVYRLLPGPVDGCGLEQLAAGDLVAALG
ncbi:MXAN_6230/SCO0854 family RING domain-containing protein [Streptomyces sp. NRRL S-237]|uniref:MXAN_6230/SCO0854 family RING domain-containing protein n=1 Tax=Streptomyces sp. NRRL S-237 TaxID=1463895 RepID=UPI0004CB54F3|nr:MXAN_6230/SCO0854 family RING domain-containing protein [Streptomyces sp. NRRL S-237]